MYWIFLYLFDDLNNHFNKFIRNISLHLNFQDVRKSTFNQSCQKMLSNKDVCNRINPFLSLLSLDTKLTKLSNTFLDKSHLCRRCLMNFNKYLISKLISLRSHSKNK